MDCRRFGFCSSLFSISFIFDMYLDRLVSLYVIQYLSFFSVVLGRHATAIRIFNLAKMSSFSQLLLDSLIPT